MLHSIISSCQTTFIPHKQILDGTLVVNEVVDLAKRRKDQFLFLKVDFEKAYDSVNWSFLDYMMGRLGFDDKWRKWIKACIFSSRVSILVNGSPTGEIDIARGLRQGDPLALFLFLIVSEGLNGFGAYGYGI